MEQFVHVIVSDDVVVREAQRAEQVVDHRAAGRSPSSLSFLSIMRALSTMMPTPTMPACTSRSGGSASRTFRGPSPVASHCSCGAVSRSRTS